MFILKFSAFVWIKLHKTFLAPKAKKKKLAITELENVGEYFSISRILVEWIIDKVLIKLKFKLVLHPVATSHFNFPYQFPEHWSDLGRCQVGPFIFHNKYCGSLSGPRSRTLPREKHHQVLVYVGSVNMLRQYLETGYRWVIWCEAIM